MKEIKCDNCEDVICSDSERFIGMIQRVSDEEKRYVRSLILETMDFCCIDCLCKYIEKGRRANNES